MPHIYQKELLSRVDSNPESAQEFLVPLSALVTMNQQVIGM
jgi:hypothetical protein